MHSQVVRKAIPSVSFVRSYSSLRQRRVVVTGLGWVTPFGQSITDTWNSIKAGETAIKTIEDEDILKLKLPVKVAAKVEAFSPDVSVLPLATKVLCSRFETFAVQAAHNALVDSGYKCVTDDQKDRAGVAIGSGIGCVEEVATAARTLSERGARRVSAYTLPRMLSNLAAGHVSILNQLRGPNHCVSTACATGAHAIGDAFRFILHDDADVMVCGGTESGVSPLSLSLFNQIGALSKNPDPASSSRPFSAARDGFVMGEGAGVLVLEELSHAVQRGARIYCEVVGYGTSGDANHVTSPPENGHGAFNCMRSALRGAGLSAADVDYINAHATSTPLGDRAEANAIRRLFTQDGYTGPLVSSTKGALGHMLGAAGSVEAMMAVLAIHHNSPPPTKTDDVAADFEGLNVVTVGSNHTHRDINVAMSNSFGFGGSNACVVFKRFVK